MTTRNPVDTCPYCQQSPHAGMWAERFAAGFMNGGVAAFMFLLRVPRD